PISPISPISPIAAHIGNPFLQWRRRRLQSPPLLLLPLKDAVMLVADSPHHLAPLLRHGILWSPVWSTILAALPVLVLFWLLVPRRWLASKAGAAAAVVALIVAVVVYGMPPGMACWSFV